MNEDQGFVLHDSAGSAHGTLAGRFSRVPGKLGNAIEFDGQSGYAWTESVAKKIGVIGKNPRTISHGFG